MKTEKVKSRYVLRHGRIPNDLLDGLDVELLQIDFRYPGIKVGEVAERLGIPVEEVKRRRRSQRYKQAILYLNQDALKVFEGLGISVLYRLQRWIEDDDPNVSLKAIDIYYRAKHGLRRGGMYEIADATDEGQPALSVDMIKHWQRVLGAAMVRGNVVEMKALKKV